MDIATILGIIVGFALMVYGIIGAKGGNEFLNVPSFAITVGGALCATMISLPMKKLVTAFSVWKKAFLTKSKSSHELIKTLVGFAEIARRDGILALEEASKNLEDAFLVKGLQLAVDGADPELISDIMNTELENLRERHRTGRKIFELLGKYGPAFGMIGTLIGLISLLKHLDNPDSVGPAMGVALVTTLYGAILANLLCGPMVDKLELRSKEECLLKEIIIQGVMSIQSGDNPRIVEQKLEIFLEPRVRAAKETAKTAA